MCRYSNEKWFGFFCFIIEFYSFLKSFWITGTTVQFPHELGKFSVFQIGALTLFAELFSSDVYLLSIPHNAR